MRRRAGVLAVAAAVIVTLSCGGHAKPQGSPGAFAVKVVNLITHNQYKQAWADLHPDDKRVAPLGEYVRCEAKTPVMVVPVAVKVVSVNDESVGLGNGRFEDSKAVGLSMRFRGGFSLVHSVHVVAKDGRWTWIFPGWRWKYYKADRCPPDTSSTPPPESA